MTDQISARHKRRIKALADTMERALMGLDQPHADDGETGDGMAIFCHVPDATTDADVRAARVMVRRRLCENGRLDLAEQLDAARVEKGGYASDTGGGTCVGLSWEDQQ